MDPTQKNFIHKNKRNNSESYVPNVPCSWLKKIYPLPGSSLKTALAIWRTYRMKNSQNPIKLTKKYCETVGLTRQTRLRGLLALEKAGLVEVDFQAGRAPIITLLDIEENKNVWCVDTGSSRVDGGQMLKR